VALTAKEPCVIVGAFKAGVAALEAASRVWIAAQADDVPHRYMGGEGYLPIHLRLREQVTCLEADHVTSTRRGFPA